MFCPSCGLKDANANQFCRACGISLQPVRVAIERPDRITDSAAIARTEIGKAFADKIRSTESARDLKRIAEEVLPEVEKFLESPAEKRLRRMRTGTVISAIGFGAAIAFAIASIVKGDPDIIMPAAAGFVTFFIGIAFIINARFHSLPATSLEDRSHEAERQRTIDGSSNDFSLPEARTEFVSVVENTTRSLEEKIER